MAPRFILHPGSLEYQATKKHWQVAKLTNGARQVCFFHITMTRGVGFILTPDSAVCKRH
jgi:hypothetical protein